MKYLLVIVVVFLLIPAICFGLGPRVDKSIAVWDQNTETDLAGYYLYWRMPNGTFSDSARVQVLPTDKVGTYPAPSYNLENLNLPVGTYFIAVSAFDTAANESGLSNEAPFDLSIPSNPTGMQITK